MALTNISGGVAEALGGYLYERLGESIGVIAAYQVIVSLSAVIAAGCWLLVPRCGAKCRNGGPNRSARLDAVVVSARAGTSSCANSAAGSGRLNQ
jgi:hypothetical protein